MRKELEEKIHKLLEEEQEAKVNEVLLESLRLYACADLMESGWTAEDRNALNQFFTELKELLFKLLLEGLYGAQVIVDAIVVTTFAAGYQFGREKGLLDKD